MTLTRAHLHARYDGPLPRGVAAALAAGSGAAHDRARAEAASGLFDRLALGCVRTAAALGDDKRGRRIARNLAYYRDGGVYWADALRRRDPRP